MFLSPEQRGKLQNALSTTFDLKAFDILFSHKLNRRLANEVNINQPFKDIVFDAIRLAEQGNWLDDLVYQAKEYYAQLNEGRLHPLLIDFLQDYGLSNPQQFQDFSLLISFCSPEGSSPKLEDAFKRQQEMTKEALKKKESGRIIPLVCIVHGDDDDLLANYRKRFGEEEINKFLKRLPDVSGSSLQVTEIQLPWQAKGETLSQSFSNFLLEKFCSDDENDSEKKKLKNAIGELVSFQGQLMFYYKSRIIDDVTTLSLSDNKKTVWKRLIKVLRSVNPFSQSPRKQVQNKIENFLKFWNELAKMNFEDDSSDKIANAPPKPILVFLFYKYQNFAETDKPFQEANKQVFKYLKNLTFDKYPNISGVVLEQIEPVPLPLIDNWLTRGNHFKGFCRRHREGFCNVAALERDVVEHYNLKNPQNTHILRYETIFGKIRMSNVCEFLNKKLNFYSCKDRF